MNKTSNNQAPTSDLAKFYDWARDDWVAISGQPDGRGAGALNFGYWDNNASDLYSAQMALHEKITRHLGPLSPALEGLDIGCGIGGTAIRLARDTKARLIGLDLLDIHLTIARRRASAEAVSSNIEFNKGNSMAMPFQDSRFDFSYCIESSFHYPDHMAFLRENMRVLKPGAFGLIADITCERPEGIEFRDGNFFYGFQLMQDRLRDVGFEVTAVERIGDKVFEPLYRFMRQQDPGEDRRLRNYWRFMLKNYVALAAKGEMGYDIFVFHKPAV